MEENIWHRLAIDVLPFEHGNPSGWRTYRDAQFPQSRVFAALDKPVADEFYQALKNAMPSAYIVPPTERVVKEHPSGLELLTV